MNKETLLAGLMFGGDGGGSSGGGGDIQFIDLDTIPARVETVGGISFDSSTDDIYFPSGSSLSPGSYYFVDIDPGKPIVWGLTEEEGGLAIRVFHMLGSIFSINTPEITSGNDAVSLPSGSKVYSCTSIDGYSLILIPTTAQLVAVSTSEPSPNTDS